MHGLGGLQVASAPSSGCPAHFSASWWTCLSVTFLLFTKPTNGSSFSPEWFGAARLWGWVSKQQGLGEVGPKC